MSDDACQTPGCGHGAGHHRNYTGPCGMGNDACPCTAYLPPRPVPEEAQVSSPGPASDLISHAAGVILQCMDAHPGLTAPGHWAGALWKAGMLVHPGTADTTSLPVTVPAPHAEAEAAFGDVPCGSKVGACAHGPMTDVERIASGERLTALKAERDSARRESQRSYWKVQELVTERDAALAELAAANARIAELEDYVHGVAGGALVEEAEQSVRRIHAEVERDMARQALTSADAMNRWWDEINAERDRLNTENAALSARLERVRALAAKVEATRTDDDRAEWYAAVHELTAAALGEDA